MGYDAEGNKCLLKHGQLGGAVFGLPLPAHEDQPAIPSDHLPLSATVHICRL